MILKSKNKEASLAYMLGFICHFMLDSETHTYVEYQIRKTGISHSELETELDRSLMEADGLNPLKEDPVKHITHEPETVKVIREFFPDFTEEDIDKTLKDMIFYLRALQATSDVKRAVIKGVLRFTGHYEGMHGLVMEKKVCPLTVESTAQLVKKLNQAVEPTARMIKDYAQYCEEDREINPRFHRTFGVDEAELAEYEKK